MEMLSDASSTLAISTNLIAGRALEWVDWKGARPAVSRRALRHEKPTMFRQARLPSKTDLTGNEAGFFVRSAEALFSKGLCFPPFYRKYNLSPCKRVQICVKYNEILGMEN